MPCVAAIQQQGIRAFRPDGIDHGGDTVQAANLAVTLRQGRKIVICQRISRRRSIANPIHLAKIRAGDMRHLPLGIAHTNVDFRFTEIDRFQLRMDVGDMDQRHIPEGIKLQQIVLRQLLLGSQTRPIAKTRCARHCGCGHGDLKKIAARDHIPMLR